MALVGRVKDIQSLNTYLNFVNYITILTYRHRGEFFAA